MADFGSPVAQNVNVNPNQGIQTLSGLLGIKQQQQALQTGQALQKTAQAEAVTRGIAAQGQSEAAGFLKNFDFAQHIGPDGTLDLDAAYNSPGFKKAGPGKELIANSLLGIKNAQIKNKADLATLNGNVVNGVSKLMGSLVTDKDVLEGNPKGLEKINAQFDVAADTYGDQGKAFVSKFQPHFNSGQMQPKDYQAALRAIQLQGEDISQQQSQQNPQAISNAAGNIVNRQVQTGALSAPPQAQAGLNPGSPQVAQATAAATGGVASDVDAYNSIRTAGAGAAAVRGLSQQVAALAKDVNTGWGTSFSAQTLAAIAQRFGYKPTDLSDVGVRRAVLGKMAAQLVSQAEAAAPSESVRQAIEKGYPDPEHMPAGAVIEAARYVDGIATVNQHRLQNAEAFKKTHNGVVTGLSTSDSAFVNHADPAAAHYAELSPAEQRSYLEQHFKDKSGKVDRDAVIRFIQNANALKHSTSANSQVLGGQ